MEKGSLKRHFFIAVNLPDHVKNQIDKQIRSGGDAEDYQDWSWKSAEEYHISLAFPGALDDSELARLLKALEPLEHESFDMSLDGVKFFLRHNDAKRKGENQHVVWMSVDHQGENDLRSLHHKIVGLLKQAGFHYGRNDITPHVTIVKAPMDDVEDIKTFAQNHGSAQTDSWSCDYVSVYETVIPDQGTAANDDVNVDVGDENAEQQEHRYKEVARYPLTPNMP